MLARLISLLRRIPAVKWAFTRFRLSPQGGSIDDAPVAMDEAPALRADIAAASPGAEIAVARLHGASDITATVAVDQTDVPDIEESPSAAPSDISADEDSSREVPTGIDPVAVEGSSIPSVEVESEPVETADHIVISDASPDNAADVEPVSADDFFVPLADRLSPAAESSDLIIAGAPSPETAADAEPVSVDDAPMPLVEAESSAADVSDLIIASEPSPEATAEAEPVSLDDAPVTLVEAECPTAEIPDLVIASEPSPEAAADAEPVSVDDTPLPLVEAESPAADISDLVIASDPSPSVAADVAPDPADDPSPATAVTADEVPATSTDAGASSEPAPVVVPPSPKPRRAPKAPTRATDPADRATLIRQRWDETGIRMWNPRLHGTGDATLNIQGRIELLPPEPGETMPRYDRLEFKMLGGQIVCEGVIVEAPVRAGHRSFTQLAEPRNHDRVREPVRERQAALA